MSLNKEGKHRRSGKCKIRTYGSWDRFGQNRHGKTGPEKVNISNFSEFLIEPMVVICKLCFDNFKLSFQLEPFFHITHPPKPLMQPLNGYDGGPISFVPAPKCMPTAHSF